MVHKERATVSGRPSIIQRELSKDSLVSSSIHEFIQLSGILDADADNPSLAIRIVVDQLRLCIQRTVDLQHLTGHRHIQVAHRLNGFYRTKHFTLRYRLTLRRYVDENDLA